jgi:cell fate regulator YaaT (PSP1 superfamily)
MGVVAQPPHEVPPNQIKGKLKKVIRRATAVDLVDAVSYQSQEEEALEKCMVLVKELDLPMKVIQAEYNFDGSRLLFSFIAEQRVDFRDLVKELTRTFKSRVEMKQVGARDETKILDGYGRCGRRLCCSSWLTEFHSVSIKMAKNQSLPLAPSEISGLCGRLLCCLAYDNDLYVDMKKVMPKIGSQVTIEEGVVATVRGINIISETVLLEVEGRDSYLELNVSDVNQQPRAKQRQSGSGSKSSRKKK